MKRVLTVRSILMAYFIIAATINFMIGLDVIYSSIAGFEYSAIHDLPVQSFIIRLFLANSVMFSTGAALAGKMQINREASKKTVRCFFIIGTILLIILAEAYDVLFSCMIAVPKSILLNLPAEKWVFACIAFTSIGLLIPFIKLGNKLILINIFAQEPKIKEDEKPKTEEEAPDQQ